ncbi:hypothetical protein FACS189487_02880 [Campylobacterota bacterium]|nr:hypothetical protein FACS189487_02880 [Campylobacterota bacterium]
MGKRSLLVKSAEAIEKLARVDTFIFDKTGTITKGDFKVVEIVSLDRQWSEERILSLAASIEEHYFHPIAQAIVEAARTKQMTHFAHGEVEFIAAHGVCAFVEGKKVVIGSRHYLEQDEAVDFAPYSSGLDGGGGELTSLYIGIDGKLLGVISLKDEARGNAKQTLVVLRALGVKRFVMLTGDTADKALALADELGFDECHCELKPDEKSAIVRDLRDSGAVCAFVGDGINDAAAILFADVGIAMQKGADIAKASADISLLGDDIGLLGAARSISLQADERISGATRTLIAVNSAILFAAAVGAISGTTTGLLHNSATIAALSITSFRDFKP